MPGIYVENVVVSKPLTIRGAGPGTRILPALSNPDCSGGGGGSSLCAGASNVFLIQADDVTISRLVIDGDNPALTSGVSAGGADLDARNGIITNHLAGAFNNLTVDGVTVRNVYLRGIYASSGGSFDFRNNTVTNVQASYYSIAIFAWYGPGVMANNRVSWASDAISANHSKGIKFLNNLVTHSQSGVHTDNSNDGGGAPDLIQGNRVSDCQAGGYGVWVFVPYAAPVVRNNTVSGCDVGFGAFGGRPDVTPLFAGNTARGTGQPDTLGIYVSTTTFGWGDMDVLAAFSGNRVDRFETGMLVETTSAALAASATFDRGTLTANGTGLLVTGGTATVTSSCITKNDIGLLQSGGSAIAHNNVIARNSSFGARDDIAAVLDATGNYWGSPSGPNPPGSGDAVSGNVLVSPFLASPPPGVDCGSGEAREGGGHFDHSDFGGHGRYRGQRPREHGNDH
jgi:hypothetical protein